jgi:hypothetical protein
MTRRFLIAVASLVAASVVAANGAAQPEPGGTATVRVGAKTFTFRNGGCDSTSGYLTVKLGAHLSLTVGRLPVAAGRGAYTGAVISGARATYAVGLAHVALAGGRARGTFTGRIMASTRTVSGTFAC